MELIVQNWSLPFVCSGRGMPAGTMYSGRSAKGSLASQAKAQWKAKPKAPRTMAGTDKQLVRRAAKQAAQALALAKAQRKETEVKYTTGNYVDSSLGSPSLLAINGIAQGATKTNRVGERVKITRIVGKLKYCVNYQSAQNGTFRTIIFLDKQQLTSGAAPGATDLLEAASTVGMYNDAQQDRFRVLYENSTTINQLQGLSDTVSDVINFDIKLPAGITTEYFGAGSSDFSRNGIYILTLGDIGTIADPDLPASGGTMSTYAIWRTYFEDL